MNHVTSAVPKGPYLLKVGCDLFRITGDPQHGWRWVDDGMAVAAVSRYPSIDELFFALLNFSLAEDGKA